LIEIKKKSVLIRATPWLKLRDENRRSWRRQKSILLEGDDNFVERALIARLLYSVLNAFIGSIEAARRAGR